MTPDDDYVTTEDANEPSYRMLALDSGGYASQQFELSRAEFNALAGYLTILRNRDVPEEPAE